MEGVLVKFTPSQRLGLIQIYAMMANAAATAGLQRKAETYLMKAADLLKEWER